MPLDSPTDWINLIDPDAENSGCSIEANVIMRLPQDFVDDCEAAEPGLNISLLRRTCENWTVSDSVVADDTLVDDTADDGAVGGDDGAVGGDDGAVVGDDGDNKGNEGKSASALWSRSSTVIVTVVVAATCLVAMCL